MSLIEPFCHYGLIHSSDTIPFSQAILSMAYSFIHHWTSSLEIPFLSSLSQDILRMSYSSMTCWTPSSGVPLTIQSLLPWYWHLCRLLKAHVKSMSLPWHNTRASDEVQVRGMMAKRRAAQVRDEKMRSWMLNVELEVKLRWISFFGQLVPGSASLIFLLYKYCACYVSYTFTLILISSICWTIYCPHHLMSMSPDGACDVSCDLWSHGLLFYHVICTILLPFDGRCYGMTPMGDTLLTMTPLMGDYLSLTHYAALMILHYYY